MAEHKSLTSLFSDIANSIRAKTGSTDTIAADDFPTAIDNIPSGGGGGTIKLNAAYLPHKRNGYVGTFNTTWAPYTITSGDITYWYPQQKFPSDGSRIWDDDEVATFVVRIPDFILQNKPSQVYIHQKADTLGNRLYILQTDYPPETTQDVLIPKNNSYWFAVEKYGTAPYRLADYYVLPAVGKYMYMYFTSLTDADQRQNFDVYAVSNNMPVIPTYDGSSEDM